MKVIDFVRLQLFESAAKIQLYFYISMQKTKNVFSKQYLVPSALFRLFFHGCQGTGYLPSLDVPGTWCLAHRSTSSENLFIS